MTTSGSRTYQGHSRFFPYLLNRLMLKLNEEFGVTLFERGLSYTQWRVLAFLNEREGLTISALAEATVTELSTLSRALAKMERRGLTRRGSVADDNRSFAVYLQPAGRALFEELLEIALANEAQMVAGIAPEQMVLVLETLAQVERNLDGRQSTRAARTTP